MSIGWVLRRDWIVVDRPFADELNGMLALDRQPPGSTLVLVARSMRHAPEFILRVAGHPVIVITESYDGNDGAIDTSGVPGAAGAAGSPAAALSLYALAATNVRLVARGGSGGPARAGTTGGDGGAGALVTFRAFAPPGIRARPELSACGGAGHIRGPSIVPALSWYTQGAQWRSDVDAILGTRAVAHAA